MKMKFAALVPVLLLEIAVLSSGCIAGVFTESPSERMCGGMSLEEAMEIAENSVCMENATTMTNFMCNENTGTWWMDIDLEKQGCNPACVVDVNTGRAEINWRCTGLLV
jgi:hypothetical protein